MRQRTNDSVNWSNLAYTSSSNFVRYAKTGNLVFVHICYTLSEPTTLSSKLPVGYRPSMNVNCIVLEQSEFGMEDEVAFTTDGSVYIGNPYASATAYGMFCFPIG